LPELRALHDLEDCNRANRATGSADRTTNPSDANARRCHIAFYRSAL
jgi:hypothetical protein